MNENALWSVFWLSCSIAITGLCFSAKSCNDADNRVWSQAIEKGCSVLHCGNGVKVFCGVTGPLYCQ